MRVKVFTRSIREGFIGIFRNYHCKDMILPLFLLVFLFNGMVNASLAPSVKAAKNDLISRITTAVFDKKRVTEGSARLKKVKVASLPKATPRSSYVSRVAATASHSSSSITAALAPVVSVKNTIVIASHTLPIIDVSSTSVDAGSSVAHIDHLYYGHRSTVFSFLAGLPVGTEFTINYGGASATYRIARTITLDNSIADASGATQASRLMPSLVAGNYQSVYDPASKTHIPAHYDAVLMTCAGASGKGISGRSSDAEARTVVLAKRI